VELFQRLFGGKQQTAQPCSKSHEECLPRAGWTPDRACDLAPVGNAIAKAGFHLVSLPCHKQHNQVAAAQTSRLFTACEV
jgi:hypothetical protein